MVHDPLLGKVIAGKFELRALLGSGAMGKVYRAHHLDLDRPVAVKLLLGLNRINANHAKRFKVEAKAASRLDHPNSVQILDFGESEADGLLYLVMEHLEGRNLQLVLRRSGAMDPIRIAWIMMQVFSALAAAHDRKVIHRDIKPGNIMLVDRHSEDGEIRDFVKVCDFGLAKIIDAESTSGPLTAKGAVFGTPAYMSPEQARGDLLDPRADIYSCGVVMYKMIAGHAPFKAETPTALLMKHIRTEPPPLSSWGVPLDQRLVEIVERAMAKRKEDRFQTCRDARNALRRILEDEGMELPSITGMLGIRSSESPRESSEVQSQSHADHARAAPARNSTAALPLDSPEMNPDILDSQAATAPTTLVTQTSFLAIIPGAMAVVGLLVIVVYLSVMRAEPKPAPQAPTSSTISKPPPPPPSNPAPPMQKAPAQEPDPATSSAVPSPEASKPPPPQERKQARKRQRTPTPKAPPPPTREPPDVTSEKEPLVSTSPQEPEIAVPSEPEPTPSPPPEAPKIEAPPNEPSRTLPEGFELAIRFENLEVDGGLSKRRCQDGLRRSLDPMKACLRRDIASNGVHTKDQIHIQAEIRERGRLSQISTNGTPRIQTCIKDALSRARLPRPDTGRARIAFDVAFQTRVP